MPLGERTSIIDVTNSSLPHEFLSKTPFRQRGFRTTKQGIEIIWNHRSIIGWATGNIDVIQGSSPSLVSKNTRVTGFWMDFNHDHWPVPILGWQSPQKQLAYVGIGVGSLGSSPSNFGKDQNLQPTVGMARFVLSWKAGSTYFYRPLWQNRCTILITLMTEKP